MSLLERLTALEEEAKAVRADIVRDTRLLEVLNEARIRVNLDTELFSGLFEFDAEITEVFRGRLRKRIQARLEANIQRAEGLLVKA